MCPGKAMTTGHRQRVSESGLFWESRGDPSIICGLWVQPSSPPPISSAPEIRASLVPFLLQITPPHPRRWHVAARGGWGWQGGRPAAPDTDLASVPTVGPKLHLTFHHPGGILEPLQGFASSLACLFAPSCGKM